jgi:hypothetical protein
MITQKIQTHKVQKIYQTTPTLMGKARVVLHLQNSQENTIQTGKLASEHKKHNRLQPAPELLSIARSLS